ncbi:ABC transporter ATP-binding protein, partial [Rhizobium lusitanum]|uniref:ABC transporter ATP-binding protein n=1 Tax=Rhizobium lusitanum TaxID=293958 RepID=UPI001AEF2039
TATATSIIRRSSMHQPKGNDPGVGRLAGADAPLLQIDEVAVRFSGDRDVLAQTSLTVRPGEFIVLLGPSGCGKSTLLNLTAGTLRPRQGSISFSGKLVTSINRNVGYVTQEDTMLPWLTLAANVGLPLRMRRVPRAQVRDKVMTLLKNFSLDHAANLHPAQLSGGMKKRGLLARALIYEPKLLLMDEPFAALDAQMRSQLQAELRRVVRTTGVAVLFVTHDIEEAALLADRVVVIGGSPGHIIDDIAIPLGPERDPEVLRFDDTFRDVGKVLQASLARAKGEQRA